MNPHPAIVSSLRKSWIVLCAVAALRPTGAAGEEVPAAEEQPSRSPALASDPAKEQPSRSPDLESDPAEEQPLSYSPDAVDEPEEEILVTARLPASRSGTSSISSKQIEQAHPASADELLRLVPGAHIVQHGSEGKGHQIFLRGFDAVHGSDVEVLLQGVALNEPSHIHGQGYLDLYGLIPEAIVEMQVSKGPFLSWQGNFATAGSIRFRPGLVYPLRPGLVRAEADHRGKLRAVTAAGPEGTGEQTFAAIEGVLDPGYGADRQARRAALLAGYRLDLDPGHALTALVSGQTARFETPGALRLMDVQQRRHDFYDTYGPAGEGLSDRIITRLGYEYGGDDTVVDLFAYAIGREFSLEENFTGYLIYQGESDRKKQQQSSATAGAGLEIEQLLPTPFPSDLLAGVGWRLDGGGQREVQVDTEGNNWLTNRRLRFAVQQVQVHGGYRFSPWRWIELFPSLRFDLFLFDVRDQLADREGDKALVAFSPRLAATFPVNGSVTLLASYGRGFRAPEARSVVAPEPLTIEDEPLAQYSGGVPEMTACDSVQVGVETSLLDSLSLRATGFGTFLEHEMVFDHVSNINLKLDGTRRLGAELEGLLKPAHWLELSAELTWIDARFNRSNNPVPGAPRWLAGGQLFAGGERGPRGGAQLLWVGERPLAHGALAGGYLKLDLDAGWRWEWIELTAAVHNLLDTEIMEGVYHYASWFDRNGPRSVIPRIHYVAGEPITGRLILTIYL